MRKNWNSSTHENISSTVAASLRVCNKVFAQLWCIKGIALLPTENRAQVQGSVGASILVTCMRRDSEQDPGGCSMPTGKLERTTRYLLMKAAYAFHAQILRSETGSYSHLPLYKIHFTNLLHFWQHRPHVGGAGSEAICTWFVGHYFLTRQVFSGPWITHTEDPFFKLFPLRLLSWTYSKACTRCDWLPVRTATREKSYRYCRYCALQGQANHLVLFTAREGAWFSPGERL